MWFVWRLAIEAPLSVRISVVCEMWFVWRPVLPDGVDLFAWISGLALGGNTTLAKWRRITGRVNYRALPVAGCYLDTGR